MKKIAVITSKAEEDCLYPLKMDSSIKSVVSVVDKYYLDSLDFSLLSKYDKILVETKDRNTLSRVLNEVNNSTAEIYPIVYLDENKIALSDIFSDLTLRKYTIEDVVDGNRYFVKPLYLEDSVGIDANSICSSKASVENRIRHIYKAYNVGSIIEDYIDGLDVTVGVINTKSGYIASAVGIKSKLGILSYDVKKRDIEEYDFETSYSCIEDIAVYLCKALNIRNYVRFDFRVSKDSGKPYLLEMNLYAGLSNTGYMYRCFQKIGFSYKDFLKLLLWG